MTPEQIEQLMQRPDTYPHPVELPIRKIETHISTVWLTGQYAYKIKKPVDFGFLDFTNARARCHFCHQEVGLNRRFAPDLYEGVVGLDAGGLHPLPAMSASDDTECVIRMRQFDPAQVLSRRIENGQLPEQAVMDALAERLATFHQQAEPVEEGSPWGWPEKVVEPMLDNFPVLRETFSHWQERLEKLENWTRRTLSRLRGRLARRRYTGMIRACHGDLHLDNIALIDGEAIPFDGIEFNEQFRWIDPISDLAFLLMDLDARGLETHSHRLLQQWLFHTGDYESLPLLPFYAAYRAMVRAKITTLRAGQLQGEERTRTLAEVERYVALAERYAAGRTPFLIVMQGVSGSGKSHYAQRLGARLGAIIISSDRERKRLAGMAPHQRPTPEEAGWLYGGEMSRRTYDRLRRLAGELLQHGWPVILDATYLKRWHREAVMRRHDDIPTLVFSIQGDETDHAHRITRRNQAGADPSDASVEVMRQQLRHVEWPDEDEPAYIQPAGEPIDWQAVKKVLGLPIQKA
ncbi:bifunctional aminoglycoside phosphotransferase/ATP-binding protein [Sulfurivirga sp.]|uniref:bifunctional aminoglycoside phosphotransferase/ATP-binding protein n=1 Tax=Sulfurivirga sp. TaxID=2614236 RepID=UPI0025E1A3D8|nr:bifunctional aminoglycoside phosphotransferase/ATP-binding protein [Sulfurivirga sp.]